MPAYNSAKYIADAINSVLAQTFTDFELIIINDGSTDNTHQVISSFTDTRIKYYQNDGNKGLIYTRNKQIEISNCDYIAFLDSDDLAEKTRLEKQYNILSQQTDISFVSSSFYLINERDEIINSDNSYSFNANELRAVSLFVNPVATSSVMLKKSILPREVFRAEYPVCEDYDLWTRILINGKGLVMPEFLANYRIYGDSICKQQPDNIIKNRNKIVLNQLEYYFPNQYSKEEAQLHLSLVEFTTNNKLSDLPELQKWIYKLISLNRQHQQFEETILMQILYERILKKFLRLQEYDFSAFKILMQFKNELRPVRNFELRKKEFVIFVFSLFK